LDNHPENSHSALAGQVAIVTGGGRGLGRAFAVALAAAGAIVAVVARSTNQLADTVAEITAAGGQAIAIPADVTDRYMVEQMVASVEAQLGPVDLLINNAGIVSPLGPLWVTDPDEWWRSIEINVRSVLLCSASVLPGMVERRQGRIINLASGAGTVPVPYGSSYATSKAAIIRLSENMAVETREYGISVFAIHPGTVDTAMTDYLVSSPAGRQWVPWVRDIFSDGRNVPIETPVQLVLRLAAGDGDRLSGLYLSVKDDLDMLVRQLDEVEANQLQRLRVQMLTAS
jgi:NAD(P)-dependent dehydrogenase (short-subunit alcohol dehydrogenase family)